MANQTSMEQEGLCLQALSVALQHPAVAADQGIVCRLLQVSKAWRAAVQKSAASMTDVKFTQMLHTKQLPKLASFAEWLAKHPGLIRTLGIAPPQISSRSETTAVVVAARQLVELSLQAAVAAAASGAVAPLRMQSYASILPATTALFETLPAATLTSLTVALDISSQLTTLPKLSNLQYLSLIMSAVRSEASDSCICEIGKLTQLRQLYLSGMYISSNMRLLPAQLQLLELNYRLDNTNNPSVVSGCLDLQHLTSLQQLQVAANQLTPGTRLPSKLQKLSLSAQWSPEDLVGLSNLSQLTWVEFSNKRLRSEQLKELQHLPNLAHLSLVMEYAGNLYEVAAAWHNLPLRDLYIGARHVTQGELQLLMQHVAAATGLTQLDICIHTDDDFVVEPPGLVVCEYLRGLRDLEYLELQIGRPRDFSIQDAQHLSVLSKLTTLRLCFGGYGPYVDPTTLSLLALSLTDLKRLSINMQSAGNEHEVINISVLPAIARLTGLEELLLDDLAGNAERGLQLLTGLSRLTRLDGFDTGGPEALETFWATIRSQR